MQRTESTWYEHPQPRYEYLETEFGEKALRTVMKKPVYMTLYFLLVITIQAPCRPRTGRWADLRDDRETSRDGCHRRPSYTLHVLTTRDYVMEGRSIVLHASCQ